MVILRQAHGCRRLCTKCPWFSTAINKIWINYYCFLGPVLVLLLSPKGGLHGHSWYCMKGHCERPIKMLRLTLVFGSTEYQAYNFKYHHKRQLLSPCGCNFVLVGSVNHASNEPVISWHSPWDLILLWHCFIIKCTNFEGIFFYFLKHVTKGGSLY